jgi:DNA-binding MarR family transcriptional regulator
VHLHKKEEQMEHIVSATAQKLFRSFMKFHKAQWHEEPVAGCKPSEIRVLFCIKKGGNPEIRVSEISKYLNVTPPTVTQLVKGLEANGLVKRHTDPADRRTSSFTLTEKGEIVTQKASKAFAESLNGLIEYLGEEESNQLADLLIKVSHYYEERAASTQESYWLSALSEK